MQNGNNKIDPSSGGNLEHKDTASDDVLGGSSNLGFDSSIEEGRPLELYENRKGMPFPTAWE